ncbi:hypothetical protein SAMN05216338_10193 [Bradyrhizobium sp. Rc2d]|uniref:CsbD family protein n=1 Tax=Bradyrhizobium sp. Rc2d TaxID=1855321 RepID=UPI0008806B33|nr:CsbD family protein [Bradyrhizobium sp. Rc2d]SDI22989.1 hypothetical protein SAMN05216338_10193 [Bradyrhizobium sp. Rc2d]
MVGSDANSEVFVCKTAGYSPRNHRVTLSLCWSSGQQTNTMMDREHVKGAADKAKGAIKQGAGKLSGDRDMETEGKIGIRPQRRGRCEGCSAGRR